MFSAISDINSDWAKGKQAEAAQAPAIKVAQGLLGQRIWIKWPYLQEAVIQAVSDADVKVLTQPHFQICYMPEKLLITIAVHFMSEGLQAISAAMHWDSGLGVYLFSLS